MCTHVPKASRSNIYFYSQRCCMDIFLRIMIPFFCFSCFGFDCILKYDVVCVQRCYRLRNYCANARIKITHRKSENGLIPLAQTFTVLTILGGYFNQFSKQEKIINP